MNGNVGHVGLLLVGIAMAIVAYVLIRNEGWRATRDERQRRGSQFLQAVSPHWSASPLSPSPY